MQNSVKKVKIAKRIRRFFSKAPSVPSPHGKRGTPPALSPQDKGFQLLNPHNENKTRRLPQTPLIAGASFAATTALILLLLAAAGASANFIVLTGTMLTLGGLIIWDIITRRAWEKRAATKIEQLISRHDRLVREAARNRSDIATLKEGLGAMAHNLQAQGRKMAPSLSPESKMIEGLVTQLGALGEKPRAELGSRHDAEILELEMAPPPIRSAPTSALDNEISQDLSRYSDSMITDLLRDAVRNEAIDLFMQPVVTLPQRKARMHEIYARVRAGNGLYLAAEHYLPLAQKADLVPAIDNILLLRCLHLLKGRNERADGTPYMLNICAQTLSSREFMNDLAAFLSENSKMAARLIFELPQHDLDFHGDTVAPVLEGLSRLGVRFSMDRVRNRRIDIGLLKSRNIRFIKLDAHWLLSEGNSNTGFSRILRLKKQLDAAGIDLIVDKIEDETVLRELLDFNIDYGQGYLFGKPDHNAAYKPSKVA